MAAGRRGPVTSVIRWYSGHHAGLDDPHGSNISAVGQTAAIQMPLEPHQYDSPHSEENLPTKPNNYVGMWKVKIMINTLDLHTIIKENVKQTVDLFKNPVFKLSDLLLGIMNYVKVQQESCAIAKTTARCALYN